MPIPSPDLTGPTGPLPEFQGGTQEWLKILHATGWVHIVETPPEDCTQVWLGSKGRQLVPLSTLPDVWPKAAELFQHIFERPEPPVAIYLTSGTTQLDTWRSTSTATAELPQRFWNSTLLPMLHGCTLEIKFSDTLPTEPAPTPPRPPIPPPVNLSPSSSFPDEPYWLRGLILQTPFCGVGFPVLSCCVSSSMPVRKLADEIARCIRSLVYVHNVSGRDGEGAVGGSSIISISSSISSSNSSNGNSCGGGGPTGGLATCGPASGDGVVLVMWPSDPDGNIILERIVDRMLLTHTGEVGDWDPDEWVLGVSVPNF